MKPRLFALPVLRGHYLFVQMPVSKPSLTLLSRAGEAVREGDHGR